MRNTVRGISDYAKLIFSGLAMGAANVIPGVSGGTMAFILGIYEELIHSIKRFASPDFFKMLLGLQFKNMYKTLPWQFLLAVGIGVCSAIVSLAHLLSYSLKNYPETTFAFFFGLIIASIIMVLKMIKKWTPLTFTAIIAGAGIAFLIVTLVPVETPHVWWNLFLCGIIIICAMILPGISGSFLLLILGQYKNVLSAVNVMVSIPIFFIKGEKIPDYNTIFNAVFTLTWISAGCIIGLGVFSHFLNWLFKKFHDITVATLIGFMIGSLWKLWPWQRITEIIAKSGKELIHLKLPAESAKLEAFCSLHPKASIKTLVSENFIPQHFDKGVFIALVALATGFIMVFLMEKYASNKDNLKKGA